MARMKVLFHVNETERWQRALLNIINFINDAGQENVDIEVVANGAAVSAYADRCFSPEGSCRAAADCGKANENDIIDQMPKLAEMGVKFAACRNALRAQSLDENTLPSFVTVVSAGITEIARKQAEGYAYIKP